MAVWRSKLGGEYLREDIQRQDAQHHKLLKRLRTAPGNDHCAECGAKETTWASVNLGVFVCVQCADVHRALGTHISKVKGCGGTYLWGPDEIARMQSLGNRAWGAPQGCPSMGKEEMLRLCRAKYENRQPPKPHCTKDAAGADRSHHGFELASPAPVYEQPQSASGQPQIAAQAAARVNCSQGELTAQAAPGGFTSLDDFLNDCLTPTPAAVPVQEKLPTAYPDHLNPFIASAPAVPRKCAQDFDFDAFFDEFLKA